MEAEKRKLENAYSFALQPYERNVLGPEKLNREFIIEALEYFVEEECCGHTVVHDAISLIKELTEENARGRAEALQMFKESAFALMDKIYADYALRCENNPFFMNGMHSMRCELKVEIEKLLKKDK